MTEATRDAFDRAALEARIKPLVEAAMQLAASELPPDPGEHPRPDPRVEEELRRFGESYRARRRARSFASVRRRDRGTGASAPVEPPPAPSRPGAFTVDVGGQYVIDRSGEIVSDAFPLILGRLVRERRGQITVYPGIESVADVDGSEVADGWLLVQSYLRRR